jgi:hypothetical protein
MIISDKWKFVYYGLPRTGSTALHHWLTQPALCDTPWGGDQTYERYHVYRPPEYAADYFAFASVRSPYTRVSSLWWVYHQWHERFGTPECRTLREFLAWLSEDCGDPFFQPQAELLRDTRLDGYVKLESIHSVVELPPFAGLKGELRPVPWLNESEEWVRTHGVDAECMRIIEDLYGKDFEAFGYEKIAP